MTHLPSRDAMSALFRNVIYRRPYRLARDKCEVKIMSFSQPLTAAPICNIDQSWHFFSKKPIL